MALTLSIHVVGPTTFLQFDDDTGPYTINGTSISYGTTTFSPASGLGTPPFVQFTTAFRVFIDITGLPPAQPVTITGPGAGGPYSWPIPTDQSVSVEENGSIAVTLGATGGTPPYVFRKDSGPSHGSLTGTIPSYTYHPTTSYFGADAIAFSVHDTIFSDFVSGGDVSITVTQGVLALTAVVPPEGPIAGGTTVALVGEFFDGTLSVTFGGIAATGVVVTDANNATCVIPAHAHGNVDVVARTTTGGVQTSTLVDGFYYFPPQNLNSSPPWQTPGQWALHRLDLRPRKEGDA